MLYKLTIKSKVYSLAVFGAILALGIAFGSYQSIKMIGVKLDKIATENIPLTSAVTLITIHQLEQAIMFERSARYAEIMGSNPSAKKHYKETKKHFFELSHKVDKEILDAEEQMAHVIEIESGHGGSKLAVDEFTHTLSLLKEIEVEHKEFEKSVSKVFKYFEAGMLKKAEHLAEAVEKQEDTLDHHLEDLQHELDNFTLVTAKAASDLEHKVEKILMISSIISTFIFVCVALLIVRGIIRPLLATKNYADELSNGNLEVEQPTHKFKDEIADMMSSLSVFKENAIEAEKMRQQQKDQEAFAEAEKKRAMQELADSFDSQVGGSISALAAAATELQATAQNMKTTADNTSHSTTNVAASSEEMSMNVNTVSSAMEEMSASSSEIASQITLTKSKSNATSSDAEHANETIGNLNELVGNIGEVVLSIQDIAEQTNLLALNATIEAARAGESGKGFAVVADEVKKLATETASKTSEIRNRIDEIQGATMDSVEAMQRIIGNIAEIDNSVVGVSAAVEEQNATTSEITRSISEVSQETQNVSQVIIDVQRGSVETGGSADAVLVAAGELAELSENLSGAVSQFLDGIRSDNAA